MNQAIPSARFDVASFGELVSDPSRVAMLLSLMDGRARPASELARIAGVTPQTGSSHLRRLVGGRLVLADSIGRRRYFRLAGDHVADVLEAFTLHAVPRGPTVSSDPIRVAFSRARTCYRHLAGELGVAWLASLEKQDLLHVEEGALTLTPAGVKRFEAVRLTVARWPTGKPCLDWTERRNHLGGPLGSLLTQHLIELGWVTRRTEGRALRVTAIGQEGFAAFGLAGALLSGAS